MRPSKRGAPSSAPEISPSKKPARPRRDAKSAIVAATKKEEDASSVKVDGDPGADENPSDAGGPFPTWRRPSPEECFAARDALALLHGEPGAIPPSPSSRAKTFSNPDGCDDPAGCASVLDSLVRTILSQNTTDATSCRAFRSLKGALPTWEQVRTAPVGVVEEAIRVGGLAEIKAARIRAILETLRAEALEKRRRVSKEEEEGAAAADSNGEGANALLSLEYLREWPDAERIKEELVRFNGVGPKTAGEFSSPPSSSSLPREGGGRVALKKCERATFLSRLSLSIPTPQPASSSSRCAAQTSQSTPTSIGSAPRWAGPRKRLLASKRTNT